MIQLLPMSCFYAAGIPSLGIWPVGDKFLFRRSREEDEVRAEAGHTSLLGAQKQGPLTVYQCLQDAKWANSDILLVSDGELRQPGQEVMRKLSGAKDKLSLRVHGLIVGEALEASVGSVACTLLKFW